MRLLPHINSREYFFVTSHNNVAAAASHRPASAEGHYVPPTYIQHYYEKGALKEAIVWLKMGVLIFSVPDPTSHIRLRFLSSHFTLCSVGHQH